MKRLFCMMALTLAVIPACRTTEKLGDDSDLASLAANPDGRNIALITSGLNQTPDEAQESKDAAERVRRLLKMIGGNFEVREVQEATKDELLALTEQAAKDVGSKGTLFWYVATHGWSDGFEMKQGRVKAVDLEGALRKGRGDKKMRRLMMIFDYCGSGGTVNEFQLTEGQAGRGPQSFATVIDDLADRLSTGDSLGLQDAPEAARFYNEAIFLSPATETQETFGDTLTIAMTNVVKEAKATRPDLTIGQFLATTAKLVAKVKTEDFFGDADDEFVLKRQQLVVRALPTDAVLQSKLLK